MEDNMKKKHVSLLLAAAMAASVISGCGSSANNSTAETAKAEGAAAGDNGCRRDRSHSRGSGRHREKRDR